MSIRSQRKLEHIKHALETAPGPMCPGFKDIHLIHQAISCRDLSEINTELFFLKKKLQFPLIINALTGGAPSLDKINKKLAIAAKECGIALAVGSQTAAIEDPSLMETYQIVRDVNPKGVILANVSALSDYQTALKAIEMIEADGLQLHLNLPQELVMNEGDRNFKDLLTNIKIIKEKAKVPVIIKEVGFGLAIETVKKLVNLGITNYDIGGAGGTNFISLENKRSKTDNAHSFDWGIPTVTSLIETANSIDKGIICATGGIYSPLDILKSLVLGANIVGIATPFLKLAYNYDTEYIIKSIENLILNAKKLMLLIDAGSLADLKNKPVVITGGTREWLEIRGIDVSKYARRGL